MTISTPNPPEYTDGLGELIRAHRLYLGLSQRALAERIGMAERSLSDIEVERRMCPPGFLDTVKRIVADFDKDVEEAIMTAAQLTTSEPKARIEIADEMDNEWKRAVIGRAAVEKELIKDKDNPDAKTAKAVPHFLSRVEVAEYLGLASVKSLSRMKLPPPDVEIGPHKGWLPSTIDTWNDSRPGRGRWGPR